MRQHSELTVLMGMTFHWSRRHLQLVDCEMRRRRHPDTDLQVAALPRKFELFKQQRSGFWSPLRSRVYGKNYGASLNCHVDVGALQSLPVSEACQRYTVSTTRQLQERTEHEVPRSRSALQGAPSPDAHL